MKRFLTGLAAGVLILTALFAAPSAAADSSVIMSDTTPSNGQTVDLTIHCHPPRTRYVVSLIVTEPGGSPIGLPPVVGEASASGDATTSITFGIYDEGTTYRLRLTCALPAEPADHEIVELTGTMGPMVYATNTVIGSSQNPSDAGAAVTFTAKVEVGGTHAVVSVGSISFIDETGGASTLLAAPIPVDATGTATLTTSALPEGTRTIRATYTGAPAYLASSGSVNQVVNAPLAETTTVLSESGPHPSRYGQIVDLQMAVTSGGAPVTTGEVELRVNGVSYGTFSLDASGLAGFATPYLMPGFYEIEATYLGAAGYAPSTSNRHEHDVLPASVVMGIASSLNPSEVGDEVTFTVTSSMVDSTYVGTAPSGMVELYDGTTLIGSGEPVEANTWRFTTTFTTSGAHELNVRYAGDGNYDANDATTFTQSVNAIDVEPEPTTPPDTTAPVTTAPAVGPGSVPATTDPAATTDPVVTAVNPPASVRPLAARDALARTGAPIESLALLGAGLILMGAIVVTARRRTS